MAAMLVAGALLPGTTVCRGQGQEGPPAGKPWQIHPGDSPPSPDRPWDHPLDGTQLPGPAALIPLAPAPAGTWSLAALVDYALRNNPQTRGAWFAARSAAAALASKGGAFLPLVDLEGNLDVGNGSVSGGGQAWQATLGPAITASYLVLDRGGRKADYDEARQTLFAANWSHTASVQDVALRVMESYYLYQDARNILTVEQAAVEEGKVVRNAAEERHKAGVATIADVLQARAALSQAELILQTGMGNMRTLEGVLAAAVGLPANTAMEVEDLTDAPAVDQATRDIDHLITEAELHRPDLAASRSLARGADAHLRKVRSDGGLSLAAFSSVDLLYNSWREDIRDDYAVGLTLRFPLFTGYSQKHNELQAQADAEAARERYRGLAQNAALEVWTSYFSLQTNTQKMKTTEDLLQSAQQSYDVTLGRYQAGVGIILDVLAARVVLENARAERVHARTAWFLSMARLSRDTGWLLSTPGRLDALPPAGTGGTGEAAKP